MIVISNTSPIRYLVEIEQIDLLRQLYGRAIVPQGVVEELSSSSTPESVRSWIAQPPNWLEIRVVSASPDPSLIRFGQGEREAILLAEQLQADWLILDDRGARQIARQRGLSVTGLVGILDEAASRGLVDLPSAIARLQQTNFRISPRLIASLFQP